MSFQAIQLVSQLTGSESCASLEIGKKEKWGLTQAAANPLAPSRRYPVRPHLAPEMYYSNNFPGKSYCSFCSVRLLLLFFRGTLLSPYKNCCYMWRARFHGTTIKISLTFELYWTAILNTLGLLGDLSKWTDKRKADNGNKSYFFCGGGFNIWKFLVNIKRSVSSYYICLRTRPQVKLLSSFS